MLDINPPVLAGNTQIAPNSHHHLTITLFERNNQPIGQRHSTDWNGLCNWIERNAPISPTKDGLPLIKLATFVGDHRSDANLETVVGIEADYDAGLLQPSAAAALMRAAGVTAFVHTSPSHRPEAPRWRVLAPLSQPHEPSARHGVVGRLNAVLGGCLAPESFAPAQAFYIGTVSSGEPLKCWRVEGRCIDLIDGLNPIGPVRREGQGARRYKAGEGRRSPSYQTALDALQSVHPSDLDRNSWLAFSGALFIATYGLDGAENVEKDWQVWNESHGEKNNPDENARTWAEFKRNGTNYDFKYLGANSQNDNAKGWALCGGTVYQMPLQNNQNGRKTLLSPLSEILHNRHNVEWLIRGIMPLPFAGIMFGAPGTGKTFIAIDMAASIATATKFNEAKTKQGNIVYVAGEGQAGIANRFSAWFKEKDIVHQHETIFLSRAAVSFFDTSQFGILLAEIDLMVTKPKFIVIDTLFRATAGADVNDARAMTLFWSCVDNLKDRYNCTVLVVHHSGRNEPNRSFGSIVLLANADFEVSIVHDKNNEFFVIENTKQKDASEFEPIHFKLKQIQIGHCIDTDDGSEEVITSCVPEYIQFLPNTLSRDPDTDANTRLNVPLAPTAQSQREIGGLLCAIYDQVLKHRGINPVGTTVFSEIAIPREMIRKYYIGNKDGFNNGLRGLGTTSERKKELWITSTENGHFTPRPNLLIWARDAHYADYDGLTLTPEDVQQIL